jgi:hypothetical protein
LSFGVQAGVRSVVLACLPLCELQMVEWLEAAMQTKMIQTVLQAVDADLAKA